MRFPIDVCADSRPLRAAFGHDILSVREENRVLVTEDKDFGELVFLRGLPHPGIVRLVEMTPVERAGAMRILIESYADAMLEGAIIVVTGNRVRIWSAGHAERHDE